MSSSVCARQSRKRAYEPPELGVDDDDSDIEVIPIKQAKKDDVQNGNGSSIKDNLVGFLHWMKSKTMFRSFISSALKALGYAEDESSDEFSDVEMTDAVTSSSDVRRSQRGNGHLMSTTPQSFMRMSTTRKEGDRSPTPLPGSPYPMEESSWRRARGSYFEKKNNFVTIGKNGSRPTKHHFGGAAKEESVSSSKENLPLPRIAPDSLSRSSSSYPSSQKWQSKVNGHSFEHLVRRPSIMDYRVTEGDRRSYTEAKFSSNCLKLLDRSQLITDRHRIPLRRKDSCSKDVEFIREIPSSDVLLSRTKLVVRSKESSDQNSGTYTPSISVPSSGGSSKFTTNAVINRQEKEMYQMLLNNYFSSGCWASKTSEPTYRSMQVQVNSEDIDRTLPENSRLSKYLDRYQQKMNMVKKSTLPKPKNSGSRPIFKEHSPEDEVLFLGEESFKFKEEPRKPISIPIAPTSPFFSSDWINELKKNVEDETKERLKIAEEQNRQIEESRRKIKEKLSLSASIAADAVAKDKDADFPELTPEMEQVIEQAMMPLPREEVLSQVNQQQVTRKDMETLSSRNWLNDEVMNFYLSLIVERSKLDGYPTVYAFSSFFYPSLKLKGYDAVRRWTRKVDIFSYDLNLIPLHLGVHWCLAVIDFRHKHVKHYDSMNEEEQCLESLSSVSTLDVSSQHGRIPPCLSLVYQIKQVIKNYILCESLDKKKVEFDLTGWTFQSMKDIPPQMNGYDCGMFTLKYAEYLTRDAPITFSQQNMQYFRRRMVYEIMTQNIL